ncbi:MAG: 4-(cytidine 5'-diphospho)-2-C-methyl-D-erythritol kinase [Alphaproteobacteria bacterium CG1_02_46_17]|nr:MAG: 4-(cytidine 5'-diphospho)-2-C-methyl-D-erythritol kinase [Alphaproteobacteria bacterium CG1_02_46_17]
MLCISAPAKVNLHLHILGKTENGYHILDSLVCFTDFGDTLTFEEDKMFSLNIVGEFANLLQSHDLAGQNLIEKSVREFENATNIKVNLRMTLNKNIPLGGGLGGGSSDAAATLNALQRIYKTDINLEKITAKLGSDITACLNAPRPVIMRSTGNDISPAPVLPQKTPAVLVNAGQHCATPEIYRTLKMHEFSKSVTFPDRFDAIDSLSDFINTHTRNDLYAPALKAEPSLTKTIDIIKQQTGCLLTRLSGSGATCFGIFETEDMAQQAASQIKTTHPEWWVVQTTLLS